MNKRIVCCVFLIALYGIAPAQSYTEASRLQGFFIKGDTCTFIFDEAIYGQSNLNRVVVTGSFRAWSQDMDDLQWHLQQSPDGIWTRSVPNAAYRLIPPSAEFKFRINDGEWLSPPEGIDNEQGGNLVFLKGLNPPSLKAELRTKRAIWAEVSGIERPLDKASYRLTDASGRVIPIAALLPNTATETLIRPAEEIDIRRVYYLEIPSKNLKTLCSFDGWFRNLYSSKELGANIRADGKETVFRIFAPRADLVKLYLYTAAEDKLANQVIDMKVDTDGVWEAYVDRNLKGIYYDFTVHGPLERGNHFYESEPIHISDPYARVSMDSWGKCRVWEKTIPATPLKAGIPKMEEVIAYEVHVQDFTDLLPVGEALKGRLPAMMQPGLKNKKGQAIGFDYLVDLGINTVHLMPVQEFLHYPDTLWKASFKDDPYMIEQGISEENYQWGYRTSHCFAVESRFRQAGTEPGAERDQFRDLVQAFHDQGIAVIIDLVPNHTAENMDGENWFFHFNVLDKQYYYRTKNLAHIGAYGNEVKTENRPMVQRWLVDQCKHFIEEFGIDGFRIDLAGQIDEQTLLMLKQAIGEDKIVYGEAWIGSNDPEYEANPDWDWYKVDSPITFFQDDTRNAFKGPVSNPRDKETDRGYAGGNEGERAKVMLGLINGFPEEQTTISGINYLDIHDNWALADRFADQDWDGRQGVDEERIKLAAVLLYTSMGPIVLHGGTEIMRSKGLGPLKELVKETHSGVKVYLHGKRDTYNLRNANHFLWENVGKTAKSKGSNKDYQGMYQFWRGLNYFRRSAYGKVFRRSGKTPENYYQWILPKNEHLLGYVIDAQVLVLLNVDDEAHTFEQVGFPEGNWKLIGNPSGVDHLKGVKDVKVLRYVDGGQSLDIEMEAKELRIWVRE